MSKDGGPAFGTHTEIRQETDFREVRDYQIYNDVTNPTPKKTVVTSSGGMSLRDYFAAQAVAGYTAWMAGYTEWVAPDWEVEVEKVAKRVYELADAMLKARGE